MTDDALHGSIPHCDVDIYGPEAIADPAGAYRSMLALGLVVRLTANDITAIVGFDALTTALRDHRTLWSGHGVSINDDVNRILVGSTLNSDPPQHDTTRAITFAPLTPKALAEARERVERKAAFIADRVVKAGAFDAAADLAPYLPLTIVRDLVGLGDEGRDNMLAWGAATFELMGDSRDRKAQAQADLKAMRAYLDSPQMMDALDPNGWAQRATGKGIEAGIAPQRAVELMRDYIAPSLDTTISAIGYAVRLFAENPDQWRKLRKDRTLVKNAVEEVVRLNTPICAFTRWVAENTTIADAPLNKGDRVLMVFGAANRDPARFADPDRLDIERGVGGHVGFGHGVHACLGMHLARLEITCLLNALADRVAAFAPDGPTAPVVNATFHAFARAPVRVAELAAG